MATNCALLHTKWHGQSAYTGSRYASSSIHIAYTEPRQELIHALHAPIVGRVAELVNKAYTDTLPGLPYAELPVISVTGKHARKA